jgi:hypothetical protein
VIELFSRTIFNLIGGNPFSDPQWIPVLDLCELECKSGELCAENDELTQKCRKRKINLIFSQFSTCLVPDECVKKMEELKKQQTRRSKRIRKLSESSKLISRTLHRR